MRLSDALSALDSIVSDIVAPQAAHIDADAAFPSAALDALGSSGLLGLVSAPDVGGLGGGVRHAAQVVERLARACASTAMVTCMHYAGTAVIEALGPEDVRRAIASGRHLSTLAFSEAGSRSHFWAPRSTARADGDSVVLDAHKSWATSARHASSFVWSSRPVAAEAPSTLWLVPNHLPGLRLPGAYDGLGLCGNDSAALVAEGVRIPAANRLGPDGGGFDAMMGIVLPIFSVMSAGCSIGIMDAAIGGAAGHVARARHEHLGTSVADLPTVRAYLARSRVRADSVRALWQDTLDAHEAGRPDALLRVLESKAAAGEAALEVTATCMRVCGGAAYRKDLGVERAFRDAQAASVMAPTTDQLYDFIGKAVCGMPLF